jgi:VanZ like family
MAETREQIRRRKSLVRGLGWCVCVTVWTVALLTTYPAEVSQEVLPRPAVFPTAKALHVCTYAFLTVWISWIPIRGWRWLLLSVLSLHAFGTEFMQQFVPERTGSVRDIFIDHFGMFLGLAFTWKRWLPKSPIVSSR